MCRNRFVETICFEAGAFGSLAYHNRRMNRTRREVFGIETPLYLENYLDAEAAAAAAGGTLGRASGGGTLPDLPGGGISGESSDGPAWGDAPDGEAPRRVKCRVEYAAGVVAVEYAPYALRPVSRLRLMPADGLDYRYKRSDRTALEALFAGRGEADDVLLVQGGRLTDTSICNIALFDGEAWYTPDRPLLAGTRRAALLEAGLVFPRCIPACELGRYRRIRLFNAMIGFGEIDLPAEVVRGIPEYFLSL